MVLVSDVLKINQTEFVKSFEIIIQLGAILAVIFLYWKRLLDNKNLWKNLITAFLPTAFLGLIFYKIIKHFLLGNTYITLLALLIGGIALIILELIHKEKDHHLDKIESLSLKTSFLIGIFQSISMIPGVSRSAATIVGGLLLGVKRKVAVEFSFLLAVPTMIAASGLDIIESKFNFTSYEYSLLAVGLTTSFIVAVIVIKWFLAYIQKHTFIPFGIYRIILTILFWLIILR